MFFLKGKSRGFHWFCVFLKGVARVFIVCFFLFLSGFFLLQLILLGFPAFHSLKLSKVYLGKGFFGGVPNVF